MENAKEDEGQDGVAGRAQGRGRGRGRGGGRGRNNVVDVVGTDREVDASIGGHVHQETSSLVIEKRGRGRPRKDSVSAAATLKQSQAPKQPNTLNHVAPSPAISASLVAEVSPNIPSASPVSVSPIISPEASAIRLPMKRGRRGRPPKAVTEQRRIEQAQKPSQITQSTEVTTETAASVVAEVAPTLAPPTQLPPVVNMSQQQHDWPPQHPPGPHLQQASKADPWLSWFPKKFTPLDFSNIQNVHVIRAQNQQQPLVYGCSWPVYTIHRFYRPRTKRATKTRRKPSTVLNTRVPIETQTQAQTNEEPQSEDMASTENVVDGLSHQGDQALMNIDEQANTSAEGSLSLSGKGGQAYTLAEGTESFPSMGGQGNVISTDFVPLQGFPGQYEVGQENAINNGAMNQQGMAEEGNAGQGNAINTGPGDVGQVNAINTH